MRSILSSIFALAAAGVVQADGWSPSPDITELDQGEWAGGFVGIAYGHFSGDVDLSQGAAPSLPLEHSTFATGFGGYSWQTGRVVYGVEVAFSAVDQPFENGAGTNRLSEMVDASARLGVASEDLMLYGLIGASQSTFEALGPSGQTEAEAAGYRLGFGAAYRLSDNFSVGAQFMHREFQDVDYDPLAAPANISSDSFSLRAAFHF